MGNARFDSGGTSREWRGEFLPAWCGPGYVRVWPKRGREGQQAHQRADAAPAGLLLHAFLLVSVECSGRSRRSDMQVQKPK